MIDSRNTNHVRVTSENIVMASLFALIDHYDALARDIAKSLTTMDASHENFTALYIAQQAKLEQLETLVKSLEQLDTTVRSQT